MSDENTILLFVSKDSMYFQSTVEKFRNLLSTLEEMQPFTSEVIDVSEEPEKAEEYKVDALPTLIIGDRRFVGQPDKDEILNALQQNS